MSANLFTVTSITKIALTNIAGCTVLKRYVSGFQQLVIAGRQKALLRKESAEGVYSGKGITIRPRAMQARHFLSV